VHEVEILQEIDHPNIFKLVEAFESDSHDYLVMEYRGGRKQFDSIKKASKLKMRLPEVTLMRITTNILNALQYLSIRRIVHRDIKLENILLDHKWWLKLADFAAVGLK
jgi:serine/threonine protein kinase